MAMIPQHPAPGVAQLPPGIQAVGRRPRPGIGMLVAANFTMPQNPLQKSLLQVSGVPTAIGPSRTTMHGIGNYSACPGLGDCGECGGCGDCPLGMGSLTDTFGQYGQYAVYGVLALLVGSMFFGGKHHRSGGGGGHAAAAPAAIL